MLVTMDQNRPLLGNARANPICAFDSFRPNSSDPDSPVFELFGLRFITAMVNGDSVAVTQQNDISFLTDDGIKTIDFFLGIHNCFAKRFARNPEFAGGYDVGSRPSIWIDKEFGRASSPGGRHFFEIRRRTSTLNNRFNLVEVPQLCGSMDYAEFGCRSHVGVGASEGTRAMLGRLVVHCQRKPHGPKNAGFTSSTPIAGASDFTLIVDKLRLHSLTRDGVLSASACSRQLRIKGLIFLA
jgi:hypothetical protein